MEENLSRAIEVAQIGTCNPHGYVRVKVNKHDFNVKKAKIVTIGNKHTITGQLSHHLRFRTDSLVNYTIIKENGLIKDIQLKIDRGGFTSVASSISPILGIPIASANIEAIGRKLGILTDGSWEKTAEYIIANIAMLVN